MSNIQKNEIKKREDQINKSLSTICDYNSKYLLEKVKYFEEQEKRREEKRSEEKRREVKRREEKRREEKRREKRREEKRKTNRNSNPLIYITVQ